MAGLKKKKREKSTSPNVVLVVFLVLFVLTSIGLVFWGYYGYKEQSDLRLAANKQKAAADVAKTTSNYYQLQAHDLRTAILGVDSINQDEKTELDGFRTVFNKPDFGAFKAEKDKENVKKIFDELRQRLGAQGNDYEKNFKAELEAKEAKIKEIEGSTAAAIAKHEETKKLLAALQNQQQKLYADLKDKIEKENALAIAQAKEQTEAAKKIFDSNLKLNQDLQDKGAELAKMTDEFEKQLKAKDRQINVLQRELKENIALGVGPGNAPNPVSSGPRGDFFPLLLDISPGKPLWDQPIGKITRVDLDLRQAIINLGEAHGAKPELTFNVFGANSAGKAEKQMKGTIEIMKVLGPNSSQCRITSLYDSEGVEILLNLKSRNQAQRESESPMKEGDLLFNLFWGTRVAVAGYVGITGDPVSNPGDQFRQMDDFMALCKRNGMIVDAWVDLRNGQIQGKITPRTRYLILGEALGKPEKRGEPPMKKDDMDMDKKDEPAKEAGIADRIDQVNSASLKLRNDARDKGLLMISAENFANVIGYRKVRSANVVELSGFRPTLPVAGDPDLAVRAPRERPMPEEPMPKKDDMEKDKKKDDN